MNKRKASYVDIVGIGHQPPSSVEIEQQVLGCLMIYPQSYIQVAHILTTETFFKLEHQEIFTSVQNVYKEKDTCDKLMIVNDLDKRGKLDEVGGIFYVNNLVNTVVTDTNLGHWSKTLLDKYVLRKSIEFAQDSIRSSFDINASAESAIRVQSRNSDLLASIWMNVTEGGSSNDYVSEAMKDIEKRCENYKTGSLNGITSGLTDLDRLLNGFQNSDLIILAGRPGQGKTSCAINFAYSAAKEGKAVKFYSIEMSRLQLSYKLLLLESGVDPSRLRQGNLDDSEWNRLHMASINIKNLNITIDDSPGMTPEYIYASSKLDSSKGKCDMIIIDYLGLIDYHMVGNGKNDDIGEITKRMKALAKSINVPVILLSQLSRKVEERANKKPALQDLRDSGNIEQDADIVMFVYRPEYYGLTDSSGQEIKGRGILYVEKHRNGPVGEVKFSYNQYFSRITDDTGVNGYSDSVVEKSPF